MLRYFDELKRTMEWLAQQPKILFLGQTVGGPGTFMYSTLQDVSPDKRVEMPVNESFQMQFTLGLALAGYIPISVYPRQNFLLLATADMVNMLDKMPAISANQVLPQVIIRVASGRICLFFPAISMWAITPRPSGRCSHGLRLWISMSRRKFSPLTSMPWSARTAAQR